MDSSKAKTAPKITRKQRNANLKKILTDTAPVTLDNSSGVFEAYKKLINVRISNLEKRIKDLEKGSYLKESQKAELKNANQHLNESKFTKKDDKPAELVAPTKTKAGKINSKIVEMLKMLESPNIQSSVNGDCLVEALRAEAVEPSNVLYQIFQNAPTLEQMVYSLIYNSIPTIVYLGGERICFLNQGPLDTVLHVHLVVNDKSLHCTHVRFTTASECGYSITDDNCVFLQCPEVEGNNLLELVKVCDDANVYDIASSSYVSYNALSSRMLVIDSARQHLVSLLPFPIFPTVPQVFSDLDLDMLLRSNCVPSLFKPYGIEVPDKVYSYSDLQNLPPLIKANLVCYNDLGQYYCFPFIDGSSAYYMRVNLTNTHAISLSKVSPYCMIPNNQLDMSNAALATKKEAVIDKAKMSMQQYSDLLAKEKLEKAISLFSQIANPNDFDQPIQRLPDGAGGKVALIQQLAVDDVNYVTDSTRNFYYGAIIATGTIRDPVYVSSGATTTNFTIANFSNTTDGQLLKSNFANPPEGNLILTPAGLIIGNEVNIPLSSAITLGSNGGAEMATWSALYDNSGSKITTINYGAFEPALVTNFLSDTAIPAGFNFQSLDAVRWDVNFLSSASLGTTMSMVCSLYVVNSSATVQKLSVTVSFSPTVGYDFTAFGTITNNLGYGVAIIGASLLANAGLTNIPIAIRITLVPNSSTISSLVAPYTFFRSSSCPDYSSISTYATYYRCTASSLLVTDATNALTQAGFITAAQVFSNARPGEAGVIDPQTCMLVNGALNHPLSLGIYSAPYKISTIESLKFNNIEGPWIPNQPYTVVYLKLPKTGSGSPFTTRYVMSSIFELRVRAFKLLPVAEELEDPFIMQALHNTFISNQILCENFLHWSKIWDTAKSVVKNLANVAPSVIKVASVANDVLDSVGLNPIHGVAGTVLNGLDAVVGHLNQDDNKEVQDHN